MSFNSIPPPSGLGTYSLPGIGVTNTPSPPGIRPPLPGNLPNIPPPYTPPNSANPPLNANGIVGPAGTNITTPDSQGSNGFLDVVGGALGAILGKAGDALGLSQQVIAKPVYETLLHPDTRYDLFQHMFNNAYQFGQTGGKQGSINPLDAINYLDERFDQNSDPGLVKFAGLMAFDPLTYLSSGVLKAGQSAMLAGKLGTAGEVSAQALNPAIFGMQKYEKAVDAAVGSASAFVGHVVNANPSYPLVIAKDNARGVLTKVLPEGLTERILNSVPDEYNGINVGSVLSDPLHKRYSAWGLPDVIAMPDYRVIQVQNARNAGYESAHQALTQSPFQSDLGVHLRSIYAAPTEDLNAHGAFVQDILKRPSVFSAQDISKLSKAVGGNLDDPTELHVLDFNNIVSNYRRGPSISGVPDGIDTHAGVDGIAAALGADLQNNPKAGDTILKALRTKDAQSLAFIDDLSNRPRQEILQQIALKAGDIADQQFTHGIQQQRINNTIFDQFLNHADNVYDNVWKQKIYQVNRFINTFDVLTLGMPMMQVAEAKVRHIIEGAGNTIEINPEIFRTQNANIELPPDLRQLSSHPFIDALDKSILEKIGGDRPVLGWLAKKEAALSDWSRNTVFATRLSYYTKTLDANYKAAVDAAGLTIRPDMTGYFDAAITPDVTSVPELQNVNQKYVNDWTSSSLKMMGNQDAIDAFKNSQKAGQINRYSLSHIIDDPLISDNFGVAPQALIRNGILKGDATPSGFSDLIDKAIDQQKEILKNSPQVKADIFEGALNSLQKNGESPLFSARNLNQSASQILSMQSQYADIPNLYRQAEYDTLNKELRGSNGWRSAIHDEADANTVDSIKRIDPILQRGYKLLNDQGNRLGVGDHTALITSLMEQDRQLLSQTWQDDAAFRKSFFETNPNKKDMNTWDDPVKGYYPMRQRIWDGFATQHNANLNGIQQAQLILSNELLARQASGALPVDLNTLGATVDSAKLGMSEITPEEMAQGVDLNPFLQRQVPIENVNPEATGIEKTLQSMETGKFGEHDIGVAQLGDNNWYHFLNGEQSATGFPSRDEAVSGLSSKLPNAPMDAASESFYRIIEDGFKKGNSADEITRQINTTIAPSEGNANPESIFDPSSQSTQSQISGAIGNDTINESGNASATNPAGPSPNDFLSAKYANLDSIRSGIENLINEKLNNPAISDEAINYLSNWTDKLHSEFQAIPQDGQKILNDAMKVANERTNQMYGQAFTNYNNKTNFDQMMLHFFPWWMHESRRWPWLTRTFAGKPTTVSMWEAYQDQTNQGFVPLSEIPLLGGMISTFVPGGDSWQLNPTRFITPFNPIQPTNQFRPTQYSEGLAGMMQGVDKILSQVGFSPSNLFDIPQAIAQGQPGAELPGMIKSAIGIARASNVPGLTQAAAGLQNMLPDNYRDYYTRMILASNGFEPDDVYDKALDGDSTAQSTLDTAQQQSSLVSMVLAQTGVLRYRTPNYSAYQNQRMQAVESMTGIPVATQVDMKNDGISIRQLQGFSPEQRQELANLPGAKNWNEITEPMLNPAARQLRKSQREFFNTLDTERDSVNLDQEKDDRRLQSGLISGVEWRKRYQDRAGTLSNLINDMKKTPAYKNVPLSMDEQAQARARFNLPVYVQSPEDIALNAYYSVKPVTDVVTGDVDWSQFFDERQKILDQNPILKPMLDEKLAKNNTAQVQDFKAAANLLRPYFGIKDSLLSQHPEIASVVKEAQLIQNQDPVQGARFRENHPELATLNTLVRKMQQQARQQFPQIDQALVKYYGAQPIEIKSISTPNKQPTPAQIPQFQAAI